MKRVVISGGAGFIGFHLSSFFLEKEAEVICLDNCSSGSSSHIDLLSRYKNFKYIFHDIVFPIDLECDLVCHLACPASPKFYQKDPIQTLETCFVGTKNMLDLAKKNNACFFFSSTSEVYGDPLIHPQSESYFGNVNSFGERACYDEGKRVAEALCFHYQKLFGLNIKIARIFNTYGPFMRLDDGRAVSDFIVKALKNEPLEIFGKGDQTRSFCFISDLIDGIIKLIESKDILSPINLGNPSEITILELARLIQALTASSSPIIFKACIPDDPKIRKPDINLATKLLKFRPKVDLKEGLIKTIHDFKTRLEVS